MNILDCAVRPLRGRTVGLGVARGGRIVFAVLLPTFLWACSSSSTNSAAPKNSPFRVYTASVGGPEKAGTNVTASVACPTGMVLVGGGANADLATGKDPSPSIRLSGLFPRGASGAPASGNRPASWAGVGATAGQDEKGGRTTGFGICGKGKPADALVVTKSVPGPDKAGAAAKATATCPQGMGLVGGGGDVAGTSFLAGSFPSTETGESAAGGKAANSWTAVGAAAGTPVQGGGVSAFAVCANGASTIVAVKTVEGPSDARSAVRATVSCPAGRSLAGGGARTGLPAGGNPSADLHLRGSFPSTPDGTVSPSKATPESWTAVGNTGSTKVSGASTSAFALCAL